MKAPLPARDGVNASAVWLPSGSWKTILDFLVDRFAEIDVATWIARMESGLVTTSDGTPLTSDAPYQSGIRLYYYRELATETPIPFTETILFQDEHIVVVDKPHFLPVVPSGPYLQETLLIRLKRRLDCAQLAPIHRLDRETAGVMLFSKEPKTRGNYQSLFQRREVKKSYEAVAPLRPDLNLPLIYRSRLVEGEPFFRTQETSGEPNAETHIDIIATANDNALYRLQPVTGRKHQLRVHMAALGIPILNDTLYPQLVPTNKCDYTRPLQLLARSIAFADPLTGEQREFKSERTLSAMQK